MRSRYFILPSLIAILTLTSAARSQSPTDPPSTQRTILTVTGKGVQIYTCQKVGNVTQWAFKAPEATLYDISNAQVGTHGAGPIWRHQDGSAINGELVTRSAAPEPEAIPWLLLKGVSPEGTGILSKVEFIRRSDTHGGVAPTTGCDADHQRAISRIPYTATYTFYSTKP